MMTKMILVVASLALSVHFRARTDHLSVEVS